VNTKQLSTASDPDLIGSYAAILRAAKSAEDTAIQTGTGIVVGVDGVKVVLSAQDLVQKRKQAKRS
jgi:hypothetical protein